MELLTVAAMGVEKLTRVVLKISYLEPAFFRLPKIQQIGRQVVKGRKDIIENH